MTVNDLKKAISEKKCRSAWNRGVQVYALEMLENVPNSALSSRSALHRALLNGADNWKEYSCGGCSLVYDTDIASRLCTPSELRKCDGGYNVPNSRENWLDVQARALYQASHLILDSAVYNN